VYLLDKYTPTAGTMPDPGTSRRHFKNRRDSPPCLDTGSPPDRDRIFAL